MPVVATHSALSLQKHREVIFDPFLSSDGASWYRVSRLGEGASGTVYLANTQETHGLPYQIAVKSSSFSQSFSLQYEKQVLCDLKNCSYVVKCYGEEVTETSSGDQVYNILLEYCSGLSVGSRIRETGRLSEACVRSYTRDVVRGLKYIHGYGYAHCNIKPENILLVRSRKSGCEFAAKIADFGSAVQVENELEIDPEDLGGTLCYMSPEQIKENKIDYAVDIWALGCSIMEMLNEEAVWNCSNCDQLIEQIDSDRVPQLLSYMSDYVSDDCRDFISKCLAKNVAERWTAKKLLKHPFLAAI